MLKQVPVGACMGYGATYQADGASHCNGTDRLCRWLDTRYAEFLSSGGWTIVPHRDVYPWTKSPLRLPKLLSIGVPR